MLDINIPFSGFYESIHSSEIDRALEYLFDDRESGEFTEWGSDLAWQSDVDYSAVYREYSKEYVSTMAFEYGLEIEFCKVDSPRYYNYSTDRIFAKISRDSVAYMWRNIERDDLRDAIKKRFTSYDGFMSHYSNDLDQWPNKLSEWDHNQLETLLIVYLETEVQSEWDMWQEYDLAESQYISESITEWLFEHSTNLDRLTTIHEYLLARSKRDIKTMAQLSAWKRAQNLPFNQTPLGARM